MCGLFGLIRCPHDGTDGAAASRMVLALGELAEERGVDAAGLALSARFWPEADAVTGEVTERGDVTIGGWRVIKGLGRFRALVSPSVTSAVAGADVIIGHTRWATQGRAEELVNASPLAVGHLIGSHNGDVNAAPLRRGFALPEPYGGTDTEVVLQALEATGGVLSDIIDVLEAVTGRAALVWADHRWPGLVMMARTALSPLAVTRDTHGNLYWASNPGWFAKAARTAGVSLCRGKTWLIPEGTLLCVDVTDGPRLIDRLDFTPTARLRDDALSDLVVWRGFTPAHRKADQAELRHRVVDDRPRRYVTSRVGGEPVRAWVEEEIPFEWRLDSDEITDEAIAWWLEQEALERGTDDGYWVA